MQPAPPKQGGGVEEQVSLGLAVHFFFVIDKAKYLKKQSSFQRLTQVLTRFAQVAFLQSVAQIPSFLSLNSNLKKNSVDDRVPPDRAEKEETDLRLNFNFQFFEGGDEFVEHFVQGAICLMFRMETNDG